MTVGEVQGTRRTGPWQTWAIAALVATGSALSQLLPADPTPTSWALGGVAAAIAVLAGVTALVQYRRGAGAEVGASGVSGGRAMEGHARPGQREQRGAMNPNDHEEER